MKLATRALGARRFRFRSTDVGARQQVSLVLRMSSPSNMVIVQVVKRPGTNVLLSSFMTIDPKETIVHLFEGKISALLRKAEKIAGDLTDVLVKLN